MVMVYGDGVHGWLFLFSFSFSFLFIIFILAIEQLVQAVKQKRSLFGQVVDSLEAAFRAMDSSVRTLDLGLDVLF